MERAGDPAALHTARGRVIALHLVRKQPLASFFALAYLFSWLLWIPTVLWGHNPSVWVTVSYYAAGLGPMAAAALVVTAEKGRTGLFRYLRRIVDYRVSAPWYLLAVILPAVMALATHGLHRISGAPPAGPAGAPPLILFPVVLAGAVLLGGGLEEPGWRGYALPRLLERTSPFQASLVLGVLWGLWHLPLFLSPTAAQSGQPLSWYLLNGVGLSIIFTWLYRRTKGSIPAAILLHAGINAPWAWLPLHDTGGAVHPFVLYTAVTWAAACACVIHEGRVFLEHPERDEAAPI